MNSGSGESMRSRKLTDSSWLRRLINAAARFFRPRAAGRQLTRDEVLRALDQMDRNFRAITHRMAASTAQECGNDGKKPH